MKNKIALRLTLYFSMALLLFAILIGGLFMMLFRANTIEMYKADLEKRATVITSTLSEYMSSNPSTTVASQNNKGGAAGSGVFMGSAGASGSIYYGGYGAYLRFIDEIAMADVWIVDENLNLITSSQNENQQYNYVELPENADAVVKEVFQGKTNFSEGFGSLLNAPTLTIGMPIITDGKIVGALLLHSPIEGMNGAISQGIKILLISLSVALIISLILSFMLASSFTKPLKKMRGSTVRLADGDFSAKTNVSQDDEIGELASAIDILSEKLNFANMESNRLDALRQDFITNISHELRTPVTVIRGSLEALNDKVITDPVQVELYHKQMLGESIFLQRLVNDLLDLSRLQNTDFNIEMHELSLCEILSDVARSGQQIANQKNIEIKLEKDSIDCNIIGDYDRLRQMFMIIIDNAIKFSPENNTVKVTLKGNKVSISNNGHGIKPEDLSYIFDRFYKVKSEDNKNGTGLGLAISKQIADRHNIKIEVESTIDQATTFTFSNLF
jgi:signal transduction histidine kinase